MMKERIQREKEGQGKRERLSKREYLFKPKRVAEREKKNSTESDLSRSRSKKTDFHLKSKLNLYNEWFKEEKQN